MWIYSFIRKDIPIAQQIVQTAHSAYESGRGLGREISYPRMVLIACKDKKELEEALKYCESIMDCYPFYESDLEYGLTSFTTRPCKLDERHNFRNFKLWRE